VLTKLQNYIKNEKLSVGNRINQERLDRFGSFYHLNVRNVPNEIFTERKVGNRKGKVAWKIGKFGEICNIPYFNAIFVWVQMVAIGCM